MGCSLGYRWSLWLLALWASSLLTACQSGQLSLQTLAGALATPTLFATDAIAFVTPTPGPPPTATPQPLAQPDPVKAANRTEEGQRHFLESHLTAAEAAFIDAIAADPSYVPAYLGLTKVYLYWPPHWQQALATAQAAAKLAPVDPNVLIYLARAEENAHHFMEAQEIILRAVDLAPDNPLVHAAAADILSNVYRLDDAYAHAQTAVELDSELAEAWATLGSIAYSLSYWREATNSYAKAAALEPAFFAWQLLVARNELNTTGDVATARTLAADAFQRQPEHPWLIAFAVDLAAEANDWKAAEAGCQKLFAYNQPQTPYPDAYTCMAGLLIRQERYAEAEQFQTIAEAIAPPERFDVTLLRMRLANEQGACTQSRTLAQHWLAHRPYSVIAKRMIGVSYLCAEDFGNAIAAFQETTAALPSSVADARLLANAYAHVGKAASAFVTLGRVKSSATVDPLYAQALYEVYLILGQPQEATQAAQRWQALRPQSTDARTSLALAQLLNGDVEAAQRNALDALGAGGKSSTVYTVLGETYSRQGNYKEAEENLLEALAHEPEHFLAHSFISALYVGQGDCNKAVPHLRWLQEKTEGEPAQRYAQLLAQCQGETTHFTPDPKTALDDASAIAAIEEQLRAADVEPRSVRFSEDNNGRSLVVAYESKLDATSDAFAQQERDISRILARILTRVNSQPDGLIVLTGAADEPQNLIYITSRAAFLWQNGDLADEEFENTWYRQDATGLGE